MPEGCERIHRGDDEAWDEYLRVSSARLSGSGNVRDLFAPSGPVGRVFIKVMDRYYLSIFFIVNKL